MYYSESEKIIISTALILNEQKQSGDREKVDTRMYAMGMHVRTYARRFKF